MKLITFSAGIWFSLALFNPVLDDALDRVGNLIYYNPAEAARVLDSCRTEAMKRPQTASTWNLFDIWIKYNTYRSEEVSAEVLDRTCSHFFRPKMVVSAKDWQRRAQCHFLRAGTGEDFGTVDEAQIVSDLFKAGKEAEKAGDGRLAALTYQRLGAEYNARGWYEQAVQALGLSCSYARKEGMKNVLVGSTVNLCHTYLYQGDATEDYSRAIACIEDLLGELDGDDHRSRLLNALALAYSRAGEFGKSLDCARESVTLQEKMFREGRRKDRVRYTALADAYRKTGQADSSLFYAFKEYESPSIVARISATQLLYCVYRDLLHDESNALKYMTENAELTKEYKNRQDNGKIIEAGKEDELYQNDMKWITVLAFFVLTIVVLAGLFAGGLVRRRRELQIVKTQTQKAADDARLAASRVERLSKALLAEDDMIASVLKDPKFLSEEGWIRLEASVDKAFDNYCSNLREVHDLSRIMLHTAILEKIGCRNSDAARILGISPSSYVKSKQRLHKMIS